MTMPDDPGTTPLLAQILLEQGKLSSQMAVMSEKLNAIPDHEARLRALEKARWPLPTVASIAAVSAAAAAWVAAVHR